jgi:hypothetical protein
MRESFFTKKPVVISLVVGLIVITCLLIYGILVTPARQPYRDALTQLNNVDAALGQTNVSLNSSKATDEEFAKNVDAVRAAFTSLQKENTALGKEAVLTNGEGKTLYVAYNKDLQKYTVYNTAVLTSLVKVRPVLQDCSAKMGKVSANTEGATVMAVCATNMQNASDVPDADYRQLAEAFQTNYADLAATFNSLANTPANSPEWQQLAAKRDKIIQNLSDISTTFSNNVQQHRNEILMTSSATDLKSYLEDKSRIF